MLVRVAAAAVGWSLVVATPWVPTALAQDPSEIRCVGVELAPALGKDPDRNPDGSPVKISPDRRGKFVPVVMVHGWTGRAAHTDDRTGAFSHRIDLSTNQLATVTADRSLIGQLQRIPGAAVFTFDYHDYSARWVDDPHIGPALGDAIDCLFKATGEKVIVVAHSMGGLATRYALTHRGAAGVDRATEVSTVVTFGTPNTGSLLALLGDITLTAGAVLNSTLAVVRLILAVCGQLATAKMETGTLCDLLPAAVGAFDSEAGRALHYGSAQLAELKPFPSGVQVDALAGDTVFTVPKAGWFHLPWEVDTVPAGDVIVMPDSATNGAALLKTAACTYQLSVVRGIADTIGLTIGMTARNDVAQPITSVKGACFHTNLMRTIELTNEATGIVNEDIEGRLPVNANDYRMSVAGWEAYQFISPSGNFSCGISGPNFDEPAVAACQGATEPVPPRPTSCPEQISWGYGLFVNEHGDVDYMCAGGLTISDGTGKVLPYGKSLIVLGFTCTSAPVGISCTDSTSGHGFRIASRSNETF